MGSKSGSQSATLGSSVGHNGVGDLDYLDGGHASGHVYPIRDAEALPIDPTCRRKIQPVSTGTGSVGSPAGADGQPPDKLAAHRLECIRLEPTDCGRACTPLPVLRLPHE